MLRSYELINRIKKYIPDVDGSSIIKAYFFAMQAHKNQIRASGDPYITHAIEVAAILADLKLDTGSITAAILHDVIEDTNFSFEDIVNLFGYDVAHLVEGVTKLSRLHFRSEITKQAENFRKLVLAMSNDIRVLLIKLADRLHNIRTLHHIANPKRRERIAQETIEIYAPLAGRIGMHNLKDEIEDKSFSILYPDIYESIKKKISFLKQGSKSVVRGILQELENITKPINGVTIGRIKTPYSIWLKMKRKQISIEQLSDIIAFRILVDDIQKCYEALGIIHCNYPAIQEKFKDYISTPKPNGYKSLHTYIIGPFNHRIEVQIRTHRMNDIAEFGVAAHWMYKENINLHDGTQYAWIRGLLEILEHAPHPREFLEHTKMEMFSDQVFCFTPNGELISLPNGATPIDFAYAIHSDIGNTVTNVKINGILMPLNTILCNGDQVCIVTDKETKPSPAWESFVVTGKAKTYIRRFILNQQRDEFIKLGIAFLEKEFASFDIKLNHEIIKNHLDDFAASNLDDFFVKIGEGKIKSRDVLNTIYAQIIENTDAHPKCELVLRGLTPGIVMHYAKCCHPIPGDNIIGVIGSGYLKGIKIHIRSCYMLRQVNDFNKIIDIDWEHDINDLFIARVRVLFQNEPGSFANLATIISNHDSNITNIKIMHRSIDIWNILLDINVYNLDHLKKIIQSICTMSSVKLAERS